MTNLLLYYILYYDDGWFSRFVRRHHQSPGAMLFFKCQTAIILCTYLIIQIPDIIFFFFLIK